MSSAQENESSLAKRFQLREVRFSHRDVELHLLLPQSAEDLLDEEAFARDERMPYWADLWPSARALARYLIEHPLACDLRVIELGCGLGLPSLVLLRSGGNVLVTDHNEDALLFVQVNAARNGLGDVQTKAVDFRPPYEIGNAFDVVLAADVLYEQRNALALVDFLPRLLKPEGRFLLADPGRRWAGEFRRRMRASGFSEKELAIVEEAPIGSGAPSVIEIMQWTRRAEAL